jgi:hypothetical protein
MSQLGLERVKDFSWEIFDKEIVRQAEEAIIAYQERYPEQQETGQTEEGRIEDVGVRSIEIEDQATQDDPITEGNGKDADAQTSQDGALAQEEEV